MKEKKKKRKIEEKKRSKKKKIDENKGRKGTHGGRHKELDGTLGERFRGSSAPRAQVAACYRSQTCTHTKEFSIISNYSCSRDSGVHLHSAGDMIRRVKRVPRDGWPSTVVPSLKKNKKEKNKLLYK